MHGVADILRLVERSSWPSVRVVFPSLRLKVGGRSFVAFLGYEERSFSTTRARGNTWCRIARALVRFLDWRSGFEIVSR